MDKAGLICILNEHNFSYKENDNQVMARITRKCYVKFYIDGENIVKHEVIVNRFIWSQKGNNLKATTKMDIVVSLVFILFITFGYILEPDFFHTLGGITIFIGVTLGIFSRWVRYLYYYNRLSKIKKLLHIKY